jgi:hypothetical protein
MGCLGNIIKYDESTFEFEGTFHLCPDIVVVVGQPGHLICSRGFYAYPIIV